MPAQALTLQGGVEKSDVEGRIGVRISGFGHISKVHAGSPADRAGLKKDDRVLLVDGEKYKSGRISGEPGTGVLLDVKRHREKFQVSVERTDFRQIYY